MALSMKGKKGWFKHPVEHGLAAKGIKTKKSSLHYPERVYLRPSEVRRQGKEDIMWVKISKILWHEGIPTVKDIYSVRRSYVPNAEYGDLTLKNGWKIMKDGSVEYIVSVHGRDAGMHPFKKMDYLDYSEVDVRVFAMQIRGMLEDKIPVHDVRWISTDLDSGDVTYAITLQ